MNSFNRFGITKVFYGALALIFLVGMLVSLRPEHSVLEKRALSPFPTFSAQAVFDGRFYRELAAWYADTYPFREQLTSMGSGIASLYGLKDEAIYGSTAQVAEDIPTKPAKEPIETISKDEIEKMIEETETGTISMQPERAGSVYVAGGRAFDIFYFSQQNADAYAATLNTIRDMLNDDVNLYDIIVPSSLGVYMDEAFLPSIGASNQKEAIDYMYSVQDARIIDVPVYDRLRAKNGEYLYFRTDHHWTGRGAYYAYEQFCEAKGIEANPLDSYERVTFPGFLGSFYASTGQSPVLAENIDEVEAFIPHATNEEIIWEENGSSFNWRIIGDVSTYAPNLKYSCYSGGDYPLIKMENPNATTEESCVLIKESYGNAFAPYLIDHYKNVYVVDYRYGFGNLTEFIYQNNIKDVIILNHISAVSDVRAAMILKQFY